MKSPGNGIFPMNAGAYSIEANRNAMPSVVSQKYLFAGFILKNPAPF